MLDFSSYTLWLKKILRTWSPSVSTPESWAEPGGKSAISWFEVEDLPANLFGLLRLVDGVQLQKLADHRVLASHLSQCLPNILVFAILEEI